MNALQLVNSVLRRLREGEVTDFSESYPKLILDFINETKREVEDAWDWSSLRSSISVPITGASRDYSVTGAGQRYRILSVHNTTQVGTLNLTDRASILLQQQIGNTTPNVPCEYAITGQDDSLDPIISFGAYPNGSYTLKFNLVVPQDELVNTTDKLKVSWYPIVQGAWARAISERGEDGGQNTIEQYQMYVTSLSDAIAQDAARLGETIWKQV